MEGSNPAMRPAFVRLARSAAFATLLALAAVPPGLAREAGRLHEEGVTGREKGDEYVRITVVLATVLLLTALSQRFRVRALRVGLNALSLVMLAVALFWIATFPRA